MRILAAEYILPISSAPISKGAVVIDDSVITAVGERRDVAARYPDVKPIDLGNAAILPGFINCHSHLEVTALRGALDDVEHDFHSWLLKLSGLRAGLSDDEIRHFAILGAREAAASGVTCLGDIGRFGEVGLEAIKETGLRGVVFQETEFSPDDRTADDDFGFSPFLARAYFSSALWACRLFGVEPSILLHPLDFLGGKDVPRLKFFPSMQMSGHAKMKIVEKCLDSLSKHFDVKTVGEHAIIVASRKHLMQVMPGSNS